MTPSTYNTKEREKRTKDDERDERGEVPRAEHAYQGGVVLESLRKIARSFDADEIPLQVHKRDGVVGFQTLGESACAFGLNVVTVQF